MDARSPEQLQRSVESPELLALLRDGWTLVHVEPMEDASVRPPVPKLGFLLMPPKPPARILVTRRDYAVWALMAWGVICWTVQAVAVFVGWLG